mgnify:CR=1 FL=1
MRQGFSETRAQDKLAGGVEVGAHVGSLQIAGGDERDVPRLGRHGPLGGAHRVAFAVIEDFAHHHRQVWLAQVFAQAGDEGSQALLSEDKASYS